MKRISAVVDDEIVSFFQNHREYNLSEIVRNCLRRFMHTHGEVKIRVEAIVPVDEDSKKLKAPYKVGEEVYMIRKEWEELEKDKRGKYIVLRDPDTERIAIMYLKEVDEHGNKA